MVRIGACGFSYDDLIGPFYPQGLPARANSLSTRGVLNGRDQHDLLHIQDPRLVQGWAERTPADFLSPSRPTRFYHVAGTP